MVKMLIWPTAIYTAIATLSDATLYRTQAWGILTSFASTVGENVLTPHLLMELIMNLGVLATIGSMSLQVFEVILALIFSIVFWFLCSVGSSILIVALFAIGIQTIWSATVFMKLAPCKFSATFGALFHLHGFIIAQSSEKYNDDGRALAYVERALADE